MVESYFSATWVTTELKKFGDVKYNSFVVGLIKAIVKLLHSSSDFISFVCFTVNCLKNINIKDIILYYYYYC